LGIKRSVVGAEMRLSAVVDALASIKAGVSPGQAMTVAGGKVGVGKHTMYRWYALVEGRPKDQWLALLDPDASYGHRAGQFSYPDEAYEFYKAVYLKTKPPSKSQAYSALVAEAKKRGWVIPSERSMLRRLQADGVQSRSRYDTDL
jgi:putative transposase